MEQETKKPHVLKRPWMHSLLSFIAIFGLLIVFLFWQTKKDTIFIEKASLEAPVINLAPSSPGVLNALYVKEGDQVLANTEVALVGSQIISTQTSGRIASAPMVLGAYFNPGQTVVSVVNDEGMKVVGELEETKGLASVATGQEATFTVDTFPGKVYQGVVSEVSPVSNDNGIVFSISDQRPIKKFNIKVDFNTKNYPELRSGMSAKITIYTK